MNDASTATPMSLLLRLKDRQQADDWSRFVDIYGPVIYSWVRRRRLQAADAADVTQEVLAAVARTIGRWQNEPTRAPFRAWLWTITKNKVSDFWRLGNRNPRGSGDSDVLDFLHQLEDTKAAPKRDWDESYHGQVLQRAMRSLRPLFTDTTWQAFHKFVIDESPAKQVAGELGMSLNAVYVAKSRVLASLRRELNGLLE